MRAVKDSPVTCLFRNNLRTSRREANKIKILELVERADSAGSGQIALIARATRGLRRPSSDARSKGQTGHPLVGIPSALGEG